MSVSECAYVCICVRKCVSACLPARVRSRFTVLPYDPETSESRPCDGDGDLIDLKTFTSRTVVPVRLVAYFFLLFLFIVIQAFTYIEHTYRHSRHQHE